MENRVLCNSLQQLILTLFLVALAGYACAAETEWENIGPEGGYFPRIVPHPTDGDIILAGSDDSGGIYRSEDGGDSWALVTANLQNACGWDICFDPNDSTIVYACDLYGRHPIIKSTDAGETWSDITPGSGPTYGVHCSSIEVDPTDSERIYVSTGFHDIWAGNGLWKTTNGGTSWSQVGFSGQSVSRVSVQISTGYVYASVSGDGFYRSTNNGASWTEQLDYESSNTCDIPFTIATFCSLETGILWTCDGNLGDTPYHETQVYFVDANTWIDGLLEEEVIWDYAAYGTNDQYMFAASVGLGVKKSSNYGATWTDGGSADFEENRVMLGLGASADGDLFASTFGNEGIYRSTDLASNWSQSNNGLDAMLCNDVEIAASDPYTIYVTAASSYSDNAEEHETSQRSAVGSINPTTHAVSWSFMPAIDGHALNIEVAPDDEDLIVVGTFGRGFYVSDDGGQTADHFAYTEDSNDRDDEETVIGGIAFDPDTNYVLVSGIVIDQDGCDDFAFGDEKLWISSNKGTSFSRVDNFDFLASELVQEGSSGAYAWAATADGAWRGDYDGTDWSQKGLDDLNLKCVALNPADSGTIFFGEDDGTLHALVEDDLNPGTFDDFSFGKPSGLPNGAELSKIEVDPDAPYILYLAYNGSETESSSGSPATGGGIYVAYILTYSPYIAYFPVDLKLDDTTPIPNNQARSLEFQTYTGKRMLYVATYEGSVIRKDFGS